MRRWVAAAIVVLLLAGCRANPPDPPAPTPTPPASVGGACGPLTMAATNRPKRALVSELSRYRNDVHACSGWWVPGLPRGFVPQGLALDGRTAWISGWRYDRNRVPSLRKGFRLCGLLQMDLDTGRVLRETDLIAGYVGDRLNYCRHGGGLLKDEHGLWLTETQRLWLIDPERVGRRDQVVRGWGLRRIRGSASVAHDGRIGFAEWAPRSSGRLEWFSVADLLDPEVVLLVPHTATASAGQVSAVAAERVPSRTQGLAWGTVGDQTGLWIARSSSRCGVLQTPSGQQIAWLGGAEDLELLGGRIYVISESGSKPYQRKPGRPVTASLTAFDAVGLVGGAGPVCSRGW